jgi:hypothetical protein
MRSLTSLHSQLRSVSAQVQETHGKLQALEAKASATSDLISSAAAKIQADTEAAVTSTATRLDDLLRLLGPSNPATAGLIQLIEEIKLGAKPVQELTKLWGDAMVNGQKLKDFLGRLDLNVYRESMEDFTRELEAGSKKVSDVLEFLGNSQHVLAQQFSKVIELFRAGKVTLQAVMDVVRQIQSFYPNSDFSDLAKAVEDGLRKGDL